MKSVAGAWLYPSQHSTFANAYLTPFVLCVGQAASKDDVGLEPLHGKRLLHFGVEQLQRSLRGQQERSSISKAGLKREEAQSNVYFVSTGHNGMGWG